LTLAPPHAFDSDTALEEVAPGRWRAWAPEHWFVARGPNGGYLAALAARAAETAAGRPLRSLSLHFVAAPAVGPIDVAVTLEREGRTYSAKPLAETEPIPPEMTNVPAFMRNYDLRWALVTSPGDPSSRGSGGETDLRPGWGGWLRTREPRLLDASLVVAMSDAWAPAAFAALDRFVAAPTLDLTIHIRRPLPPADMAPEDYVLGRFTTRLSVAGVWEEDGELWSPSGELIAQSRQLALVRELPA
jgi:acyl-CoA thioesterase